jgi:LuxR family transcriptional regulator, maltose regulon positive regulatory protein
MPAAGAGQHIVLADRAIAQGRIREAMSTHERGLQPAEQGEPPLRGAADMHVGISHLLRERDDLNGALCHLFTRGAGSQTRCRLV